MGSTGSQWGLGSRTRGLQRKEKRSRAPELVCARQPCGCGISWSGGNPAQNGEPHSEWGLCMAGVPGCGPSPGVDPRTVGGDRAPLLAPRAEPWASEPEQTQEMA
jgi:hypothetical protein